MMKTRVTKTVATQFRKNAKQNVAKQGVGVG